MNVKNSFFAILCLWIACFSSGYSQVTGVNYQLKYNTTNCRYEVYMIVISGSATTSAQRTQFNSQVGVVVPAGSAFSVAERFMPLRDNQTYNGTIPCNWSIASQVFAPAIQPQSDFYGITPVLTPSAQYNNLQTGDTIRLFSLNISPITTCGTAVRLFVNGVDPDSGAPGMEGGDFSNGFTIGGPLQRYIANSPKIDPPKPILSAVTTCSRGVEIDLTVTAPACHSPFTYQWTGPNAYMGTMQDVAINPATQNNAGQYFVTVTDSKGCTSTTSITASAKPNAGPDQTGCASSTSNLVGTGPTTGTWSALGTNPSGATLTPGSGGLASVSFSNTAVGNYKFIYSASPCSDTVNIQILMPDGGLDPSPVGCFSSGTASLNATGVGFWSLDTSSPGTATIASPSSPSTTVSSFSNAGVYVLNWNVGACIDQVVIVVGDNCSCTINNNSLATVVPSTYCTGSGAILINGAAATPAGGSYLWQYRLNNGTFANATGVNTSEDYTTINLGIGNHSFRRTYTLNGDPVCHDTSNVVSFTVFATPTAPTNPIASPNPSCLGNTINLSVSANALATFQWTASSTAVGLANSTNNINSAIPTVAGSYTVSVTQTVDGCVSPATVFNLTVAATPPTPTLGNITPTNPTTCGGNNGSIAIAGYMANTAYTVNYTKNAAAASASVTSNGSGVITIPSLTAGTYANISITNASGCASGIFAGPVLLTDPNAPPAPVGIAADPNPTCANITIGISVTNNPSATYQWTASSTAAGLNNSTTNSTTLLPTASGNYTVSVTQTVAGCTSPSASLGIIVSNTPPTPNGTTTSSTNTTACGANNGTISISGLTSSTSYILYFTYNGTPDTINLSSNASGVITMGSLAPGSYTNFSIENTTGCKSSVYAGPVTISDPNTPGAPTGITANPNPVCLGTVVNLSVTNTPGATYAWTTLSTAAGLVASSTNTTTMNATAAGTYIINVTQSASGCTSPPAFVTVTVNSRPATPTAGTVVGTNPTTCGGSNGNITLSGYANSTFYTVNYSKNSVATSANISSNASGVITLANLTAGTYTNFSVLSIQGCASGVYAGPVTLINPNAPPAPDSLRAVPNPVCANAVVNLSVAALTGATYTWTASSTAAGLVASTTRTTTMMASLGGSYTISVTQTVAGCTSPASTVVVVVTNAPPTPTAGTVSGTNPTTCAGSNGSIQMTGYLPSTPYTVNYQRNSVNQTASVTSNASGVITISGLNAGTYSAFTITNSTNCTSGVYAGPVNISDPGSPAAPSNLTGVPNPVCLGSSVALSVTNNPGATYIWSANSTSAGLTSSSTNTTSMLATQPGSYIISVAQVVAGCTSPNAMVTVVVNPIPPTLTMANIASTNPTTCGGSNGIISLSGLPINTTYTLNYNKNGNPQSAPITTSGTGSASISGLTSGSYTAFVLVGTGNCQSTPYAGPVTLTEPGSPAAPAGLAATPNPVCLGNQVALSVTNNPGATYVWSAMPNAGLVASSTNSTTMTPIISGSYVVSVTQNVGGCISPAATIIVNVNPTPPTPTQANVSSTNPTVCSGLDGTITFTGLQPSTIYTFNYWRNGQAASSSATSNVSGTAIITGLNQGTYSNFVLVNPQSCSSGTFAGPVLLSDPAGQPAPTGLTALPNPACLGNSVLLSVTNNPGATYTWTSLNSTSGLSNSTINTTSMLPTTSGTFTISVSQTVAGCTSPAASIDVVINPVPTTPSQNNFSTVNPTCASNNGSISIAGYLANSTYVVHYSKDGVSQMQTITSSGNGTIIINGLSAGSFTDFSVTNAGNCTSGIFNGPIVLTDPGLPAAPTNAQYSPQQICIKSFVTLTVNNNPAATYNWTTSNTNASLQSSSTNQTTLVPSSSGTFLVSVTETVNGCTSLPTVLTIDVKSDCYNPDFDVTYVNVALSGDVSTNDVSSPSISYGAATVSGTNPGPAIPTVSANGSYTFTSAIAGKFTFLVPVCNGGVGSNCLNVPLVITVLQELVANNPPIVNNDYVRTKVNTPISVKIAANDKCQSIPNCTLSQATIVVNPLHGTYNTSTLIYTPANNFVGLDSLKYRICQTPEVTPTNCSEAWVYVTILAGNVQNITNAMDDYNQTALNTVLSIDSANGLLLNDTDPEGNTQSVSPQTTNVIGKGSIVINGNGSYSFTPFNGFTGPVAFTYEVCDNDPIVACDTATIHLLVEPFNPVGSIGDFVWHDSNGNGIQDNGEQGVANVRVRLMTSGGNLFASTTTDNLGKYAFDNVPAGAYYIKFVQPVQYSFTFANKGTASNDSDVNGANGFGTTSSFTIAPGQIQNSIDAGLYICSQIGDLVWYDLNKNDIHDSNENGLNGLRVSLWRNHFGTWIIWDSKDTGNKPGSPSDDGYYQFCAPPGQYYIHIEIPELELVFARPNIGNNRFIDSDFNNANGKGTTPTFTVTSGTNKLDIGAGFYPMAVLGNTVWLDENFNGVQDQSEAKVSGVLVQAFDANTNQKVAESITNEDGNYKLDYLQKNDYYLKFEVPSGYTSTISHMASDDKDSDVDHTYGLNTTSKITTQPGITNNNIDLGIAFGVLPVRWGDIRVTGKKEGHIIEWSTLSENNVDHFVIERKIGDKDEFVAISQKYPGSSFSSSVKNYSGIDKEVEVAGLYYYRVRQVDVDGKINYSKIVSILKSAEGVINIYPNPAKDMTQLAIGTIVETSAKIEIFNNQAALVSVIDLGQIKKGEHNVELNINDFVPGVYNVVITLGEERVTKKLIKIK